MGNLKYLLGPMRIPFLTLTPVSVFLGLATAVWTSSHVSWSYFVLVLIGALSAHISVNTFNEYFDFKSGLDAETIKTPFSGGSGTLPERPELAHFVLIIAWTTFAVTALAGLYFAIVIGAELLPLGIIGLVTIFAYTNFITRCPLVCLVAPGLCFGPLMVMGTGFVLTGRYSLTAFFASLVPFFLVNGLLLLNQFPDVEADRSIGRRPFPVTAGTRLSGLIYIGFLLLAYLSLSLGVYVRHLPAASLIGLLTVPLAVPVIKALLRSSEKKDDLVRCMGLNVMVNILTPILVAAGMLVG